MANILEDLERLMKEADEEVPATDEVNVADAPVESDETLKIAFTDLSTSKQSEIKDKVMKKMNATDDISKSNLAKALLSLPLFDGTVEAFRNQLGIENI